MNSGTLVLSKLRVEDIPLEVATDEYVVKIKIGGDVKASDKGKGAAFTFPNELTFELQNVDDKAVAVVEIIEDGKEKPIVAANFSLKQLLGNTKLALKFQNSRLHLETAWTPAKSLKERLEAEASKAVQKAKDATSNLPALPHPHALTVHETHRPWFMRASYYYDTSKSVYAYAKSFRIVAPFARLGENTTNAVLRTVFGKDLGQLDQQALVPLLGSLDDKVDGALTQTLVVVVKGQNLMIATKDKTLEVAHKVATGAYNKAAGAAEFTSDTVKKVTSKTFNTARSVVYSIGSHLPLIGDKFTK
jgi:hypothetical protein